MAQLDKRDEKLEQSFKVAQETFPWLAQYTDRSITELEIRHAVLSQLQHVPKEKVRIFHNFNDNSLTEILSKHR